MEGVVPQAVSVPKLVSLRNPEKNRGNRVKVKPEPKSLQELIQELAFFREQTAEFFAKVRGLESTGLNPKSVFETAAVSAEDLEEVWGKVNTYRTTNTKLHPETRRELISLYAKIYGTKDVTNNEFMMWVVKGFILECKGEVVDWATAAASTAREKAERCQRELDKCKSDSRNFEGFGFEAGGGGSAGSPPVYSFSHQLGKLVSKQVTKVGIGKRGAHTNPTKLSSVLSQERHPISEADLAAVEDVLKVEIQLLDTANNKISFLIESWQKEADRIIGLRYNMDDRRSAAKDSEESMKNIQAALSALDGSQKQSDLGSCGSTLQAKRGDLELHVAVVAAISEAPENGLIGSIAGDEVNSPGKESPVRTSKAVTSPLKNSPLKSITMKKSPLETILARKSPQKTIYVEKFADPDLAVIESPTMLSGFRHDIAEVIPVGTGSIEQSEGGELEDDAVQKKGSFEEELSSENLVSTVEGAIWKSPRYSFSKKRDSGPLVEDAPSSRTISLAEFCPVLSSPLSTKTSKRKSSHKSEEDASHKSQHRRNDGKKAESAARETILETSRGRVLTRSSLKSTH